MDLLDYLTWWSYVILPWWPACWRHREAKLKSRMSQPSQWRVEGLEASGKSQIFSSQWKVTTYWKGLTSVDCGWSKGSHSFRRQRGSHVCTLSSSKFSSEHLGFLRYHQHSKSLPYHTTVPPINHLWTPPTTYTQVHFTSPGQPLVQSSRQPGPTIQERSWILDYIDGFINQLYRTPYCGLLFFKLERGWCPHFCSIAVKTP